VPTLPNFDYRIVRFPDGEHGYVYRICTVFYNIHNEPYEHQDAIASACEPGKLRDVLDSMALALERPSLAAIEPEEYEDPFDQWFDLDFEPTPEDE